MHEYKLIRTDYKSLLCAMFHSRSKGVILNVASASGMYPVPLLTLYSSSKASSLSQFLTCYSLSNTCFVSPVLSKRSTKNPKKNNVTDSDMVFDFSIFVWSGVKKSKAISNLLCTSMVSVPILRSSLTNHEGRGESFRLTAQCLPFYTLCAVQNLIQFRTFN